MSITLDFITLPSELAWQDEFAWSRIVASQKRTIQGKLIVLESIIPSDKGRPITLVSNDAWINRDTLQSLHEWAHVPEKIMTLTMHDARVFTVRFRHWEEDVMSATSLISDAAYPTDDMQYILSLKLAVI